MQHSFDNMSYYDNPPNRSPTSQRQSSLHRQNSRQQFEQQAYGHLPSGLYTAEDHAAGYNGNPRYNDMRNATVGGYGNGYDMGGQSWNAGAFAQNNTLNGLGGGQSLRKPPSRGGRSGLPSSWMDQSQPMPMNPYNGGYGRHEMSSEPDEELIPTAIVIKNIPFAIKKEQLVQIMTEMGLPLPYAFNYHFDNGVFRGLAFANFTNPEETAAVIDAMNHFELNGRKLRVEYKKMLPAVERERIEREKRERRGQLEEQHRPMAPPTLQSQASASSLSSRVMAGSPSPVSARNQQMGGSFPPAGASADPGVDVDLNDPQVLQYYSKLLLFKEDTTRDLIVFPPSLSPPERRIVHTLAHHMALGHTSKGESDHRAVHVFKDNGRPRLSPPMQTFPHLQADNRRALNRSATTDFSDVRANENYYGGSNLRHQASGYLSNYESAGGLAAGSNLRSAKSFADLRSYTPSPVPSTASFPAALSHNVARLQEFGRDGAQSTTPTLMAPSNGMNDNTNNVINGLGNMSLGPNFSGSPRGLRGYPSWDREQPGPIGSNRSFSTNYEGNRQGGVERQPRGPLPERGAGFPRRQNGHMQRNSDELSQRSSAAEITVEH